MSIIEKTDREWQEILSPLAYKVTRKHGTERAFSHDNFPKRRGTSPVCAAARPYFYKLTNSTAARAGHLLRSPWPELRLVNLLIIRGFRRARRCIVPPAPRIWAMSFQMGPRQRACDIA